jgi:16S rRNA (cytosine967-C5)-methyltransferase
VSRAGSQQRTLLGLLGSLRPRWRVDPALPLEIEALLRRDRRLGSRDRRLYRELAYTAVRYLPWIEPLLDVDPDEATRRMVWLAADLPEVLPLRMEIAGDLPPCPPAADEKARILLMDAKVLSPAWLRSECPEACLPPLRDALLSRAPLWIRLQTADPESVFLEFERLGWRWRRSSLIAGAVVLPLGGDATKTEAFAAGKIEIQDVGSQLILESAGVVPGGHWLDACAGAGGKTLQLAALVGPAGRVTARDVRPAALQELAVRAQRAGLGARIDIGTRTDPGAGYDGVLVDAPCTGSGTWRRSPHLKWSTTPALIREAAGVQRALLAENAARVRPGGLLVYATCSLCRSENEAVAAEFAGAQPGFEPVITGRRILPPSPDGDAFFVAAFRRT